MKRRASIAFWAVLAFCFLSAPKIALGEQMKARILSFSELEGWQDDDHQAALDVFLSTCDQFSDPEWQGLCKFAQKQRDPRQFFELMFRPVLVEDEADPLFTGYFEPELNGSKWRSGRFRHPLYRLPSAPKEFSRREISQGALAGRGLELVWVDDPVELFFLQVQGSGRIKLSDGSTMRVGYAGHNGRNYKSIGKELIRRGVYEPHQVSAAVIQNWVRRNPIDGPELLNTNPSYVFFREVPKLGAGDGPIGAMNRSVSTLRTLAVDPKFVPLGAPVWIEKEGKEPMRRLMIAQDTGSAIKGAQRADIFFGTGDKAGQKAGEIKDPGRMVVLLPIQLAYQLDERSEG